MTINERLDAIKEKMGLETLNGVEIYPDMEILDHLAAIHKHIKEQNATIKGLVKAHREGDTKALKFALDYLSCFTEYK